MNSALSNLTEAYTDSENEDHQEEVGHSDPEEKQIKAEIIVPTKRNSKHPRRLVSYAGDNEQHDESITDEESDEAEEPKESETNGDVVETEDKYALYAKKYGFELPPEPKSRPDPKLQEMVTNIVSKGTKNSDFDLNKYIQARKDFRNPSIYDKLIQFCDINELGTNFPPEIYDVSIYGPESFYEELTKAQKQEMDKLEKMKKENAATKVEVIIAESAKRKSKWDQQAPATNSASTINKPTVISAFGTLKKPKV